MSKNGDIAKAVIEKVGSRSNIESVQHCMTRLRFRLRDYSMVNIDDIKAIAGVIGAQEAEGSLHVIIGTTVSDVYKEVVKQICLETHEVINEKLDPANKSPKGIKGVFTEILNVFTRIMTPLIPLFVAMGMASVIAVLIGPAFLGLVSEESDIYTNFNYIYQGILYFLPIFVAISAVKVFQCEQMLAVATIGIMLLPDMITAMSIETGYTVYGITVPNVTYSGTVIPAILVVWALSYVERFFKKYVPKALKVIGVPLCTLLIMLPVSLCILGPLGNYIGSALASLVIGLNSVAGPVETVIVSALTLFLTAFGVGRPIFFACMSILFATGAEFAYMPYAMVTNNFIAMGIAAGYLVKSIASKNASGRETGLASLVAVFLGGVSEPTIFGIVLPNKSTYLPVLISGAAAGLIGGIYKVGYYQFGPSNFLAVLGYVASDNPSNMVYGTIMAIVAAVVAFICMMIFFKDNSGDGDAKIEQK